MLYDGVTGAVTKTSNVCALYIVVAAFTITRNCSITHGNQASLVDLTTARFRRSSVIDHRNISITWFAEPTSAAVAFSCSLQFLR